MTTSVNRAFEVETENYQLRLSSLTKTNTGTGSDWYQASNNSDLWLVGVSNSSPDTKTLRVTYDPSTSFTNAYGMSNDKLVVEFNNAKWRIDLSGIQGGLGMYFTDVDVETDAEDRLNTTSWTYFYTSTAQNYIYRGSGTTGGATNTFTNAFAQFSGDTANNNSNGLHSATLSADVRFGSIPIPYINSQLNNNAVFTYYWEGNKYIFDGLSGDSIETFDDVKSTMTVTATVKQGITETLSSQTTFTPVAKNLVGFPFTGTQYYIEEGYIETGASYAGNVVNNYDYVLDGYFTLGYVEEATIQLANSQGANISNDDYFETYSFVPDSDSMLQTFNSQSTMAPVLMGQLFDSGAISFDSDTTATAQGKRIQQLDASLSSLSTTIFSGGRIFDIDEALSSDSVFSADSGRLQQIAADLVSQTSQTTIPFLLQGGEGIVAGASAIFTEGGYLQSSGSLNLRADAQITTGNNVNANLGIILKGFDVNANSETQTAFSGGNIYSINENLVADSQLTGIPGYLFSGETAMASDFQFDSNAGLSFLAPQSFMSSTFSIPPFLAGFRLLGVAHLISNSGQLAAGKKWLIDPYRRLYVKDETRLLTVPLETSLYTVDMENRLNTVIQETKDIQVKQETRLYHIPYAPIQFVSATETERV